MNAMRWFLLLVACFVATHGLASAQESAAETLGVMYWTDRTAGLYRAARDGSEIQLLVPRPFTNSIAVDREGGRLFWSTITNRARQQTQLWQGKLDASDAVLLADGLHWVGDVVFDPIDQKLYVSSIGDAKIIRMNANGSDRQDFVVGIPPPSRLCLDLENRKLYWATHAQPRIDRVNLDGLGREAVLTNLPGSAFGMSIDPVDTMIYWTSTSGTLQRAKLDGSQRQQIASGLAQPDGLAVDVENRKLYWVEKGKISQANLDGSGAEVLVSGKSELYSSLEILPPAEE